MLKRNQNKGLAIKQGLNLERIKFVNNNLYIYLDSIDNFNDKQRRPRMIGSHKTTIKKDWKIREVGNEKKNYQVTRVIYRGSEVVKFDDKNIYLDNNGYYTATTKRRMNQASEQFNLNFHVFQKNYDWKCEVTEPNGKKNIFCFQQNMLILPRTH